MPNPSRYIDDIAQEIFEINRAHGFWDQCFVEVPVPGGEETVFDPTLRNTGEAIALMHSELSEALEAHRKNLMDDKLPHFQGIFVELADTIIRILDYCAAHDVEIEPIIRAKMAYNAGRPHKHGKAY